MPDSHAEQRFSPLTNRCVVVTGGTGSFGKAFVRRALDVGASRVVVLSRDELKQSEMAAAFADPRLRCMIGSVSEGDRVALALRGADLLVHAAAMKQVPACEDNPNEAMQTNALGAQAVAMAAIEAGVSRAVFLSTDKAAIPNTLYGATKLVAERLWRQSNVYAAGTRTRLVATRYGNVIGSRGSVVPIFQAQAKTGMLTITDPDMTRFWMRLEHAVSLVELALSEGRGGEVFVPTIPACSVATVARAIAPEAKWHVTGIRPGEKMHETLIAEDEARTAYEYADHYRIEPHRTWEYLPEPSGKPVPDGFSYRSDTNPEQLDADGFAALAGLRAPGAA